MHSQKKKIEIHPRKKIAEAWFDTSRIGGRALLLREMWRLCSLLSSACFSDLHGF